MSIPPLPPNQPKGYPQPGYPQPGYQPPQQSSGKATASLVLGIVGIFLCPIICSVLAIIFGKQAMDEIERNPGMGGAGVAKAGFILGIVGCAFAVLLFFIYVIAAGSGSSY